MYKKAAVAGQADAQFRLGLFLKQGIVLRKDFRQAHRWFELAAKQGHAIAQAELAYNLDLAPFAKKTSRDWRTESLAQGYCCYYF